MRRAAPILLLVAVALAGCGGGTRVDRSRDVAAFDRIEVADGVKVVVHRGARPTVTVQAGQKVVDRVVTDSAGGVLHVGVHDRGIVIGPDPFDDVRVTVTAPALHGLEVDGGGDAEVSGLDGGPFEIAVHGSGNVTASGTADRIDATVDGSGDLELPGLDARDARVEIHGSGDVEVAASERLAIDIAGSGDVTYHGDPRVTQTISGAGDVTHAP